MGTGLFVAEKSQLTQFPKAVLACPAQAGIAPSLPLGGQALRRLPGEEHQDTVVRVALPARLLLEQPARDELAHGLAARFGGEVPDRRIVRALLQLGRDRAHQRVEVLLAVEARP